MAYGNSGNNRSFQKPSNAPVQTKGPSTALLSTGLFAPDREGSKAVATVRIKEAVTIPAGSYINLYESDRSKGEKSPMFRLQIREATKKPV